MSKIDQDQYEVEDALLMSIDYNGFTEIKPW